LPGIVIVLLARTALPVVCVGAVPDVRSDAQPATSNAHMASRTRFVRVLRRGALALSVITVDRWPAGAVRERGRPADGREPAVDSEFPLPALGGGLCLCGSGGEPGHAVSRQLAGRAVM
jgi:hypothetical protein